MSAVKTRVGSGESRHGSASRATESRATEAPGSASRATREAAFLPYQLRWIEDQSRIAVWEKSRRIGADFCDAFRAVRERITGARTTDYWYSSADESAAFEYMQYVKTWALDVYGLVLELVDGVERFGRDDVRVMSVTFPEIHGRRPRIIAMASNPKSFRSKGGDVCLSEFAFHDNAFELWKAARPVITWGGRVRILSSHNGIESMFNQMVEMGRRHAEGTPRTNDIAVSLHRTTIDDAIADGLVERINLVSGEHATREEFREACRRDCGDERIFAEEYLCRPSEESGSYFPYELLRPSTGADAKPQTEVKPFLDSIHRWGIGADALRAGIDVGRKRDRFVIWVVARFGAMRLTAGILEFEDRPFGVMELAIAAMMDTVIPGTDGRTVQVSRCCIDATGIGMQLAERAVEKYRTRVEAVTFTSAVKEDLFTRLRRDIEERTVTIPDDAVVLADINSIRKTVTTAGNVRFDAQATDLGHADRATALALALHADDRKGGEARFVKVEDRR
jgi:phage FluMu gp28-like protein